MGQVLPVLGDTDCEEIGAGLLAQPANALSSAGYVVAALVLLVWAIRRGSASGWLIFYVVMLAVSSFGSVDFHGIQSAWAQWLHDVPIAVLFLMAIVTPVVRRFRGRVVLPGATTAKWVVLAVVGVTALVSKALGTTGSPACDPESLLQYHAVWHLGSAVLAATWGAVLWIPVRGRSRT